MCEIEIRWHNTPYEPHIVVNHDLVRTRVGQIIVSWRRATYHTVYSYDDDILRTMDKGFSQCENMDYLHHSHTLRASACKLAEMVLNAPLLTVISTFIAQSVSRSGDRQTVGIARIARRTKSHLTITVERRRPWCRKEKTVVVWWLPGNKKVKPGLTVL